MKDARKTKKQLIDELTVLRQKIHELENADPHEAPEHGGSVGTDAEESGKAQKYLDIAGTMIIAIDADQKISLINKKGCDVLGYSKEEIIGKNWFDHFIPIHIREGIRNVFNKLISGEVENTEYFKNEVINRDGEERIIAWHNTLIRDNDGRITGCLSSGDDITEQVQLEKELRQIEWLLWKNRPGEESQTDEEKAYQPYGSLTNLNTSRVILDAVGEDMLEDIAKDYLTLLGTSSAVYEKNGNYAMGIFASGWCRMLDQASYKLSNTSDITTALRSGKWLCHESCWTDASKLCIDTNQVVDIECNGGIRLFAVPIQVGKETIGAINFGYGDPPRDPQKLQKIAEKYNVDLRELISAAQAYESRPKFITNAAKDRLLTSAKLIGEIVERKQAEQALRESEKLLRTVLDFVPVGIWIADEKGTIILGNPAGQQIWRGAKYVGTEDFDEYKARRLDTGERLKPEDWAIYRAVHHGETSINEELEIECFDGSHKIILNSAVPIRNAQQAITGVVAMNFDITERRKVQEIAVSSQKMASLGSLSAGIAHEINSPLQVITGLSERLIRNIKEDNLDHLKMISDLKTINNNGFRIANITRSLLTYARPSLHKADFYDLNTIIEDSLILVEHQLQSWSNISINRELAEGMPAIRCEHTSITQVMINLLTNAAHAMPYGGCITIQTEYHPPKQQFTIKVSDTGDGIPEDIQERIFEPFFTTKEIGKGTGLGLSIVQGIIQAHGGTISVRSVTGEGASFIIQFPLESPTGDPIDSPGRYDS